MIILLNVAHRRGCTRKVPIVRMGQKVADGAFTAAATFNLALKCLINLVGVESHNYRTINDDHGSGHIPKFRQIGQGDRVLRYVLLLKLYAFLRKTLLRLVAEHSPVLGINDDVLHLVSPPVGFVPLAISPLMASFAPLITSRTGPLE